MIDGFAVQHYEHLSQRSFEDSLLPSRLNSAVLKAARSREGSPRRRATPTSRPGI